MYNSTSATCNTDTRFTYFHVTVLHYNSKISTCSQAVGSLSISTALLQNTSAHKNKKFFAFYYKPETCYCIHNILLLAPFWASWIQSTTSHSISFNPVLFSHLHTVNCRVQSHNFHTYFTPPVYATCPVIHQSSFNCPYPNYDVSLHVILSILLELSQKIIKEHQQSINLYTFTQNTQILSSSEVLVDLLHTNKKCDYDIIANNISIDLCPSGIPRIVAWWFRTTYGQHLQRNFEPISRNLEDGSDNLSRNVGTELPLYAV